MLLAIDIGNTEITIGLFAGDRLVAHWRMTTRAARTDDEWMVAFTAFLAQGGHAPGAVKAAVVGSVAPAVTDALLDGVHKSLGVRPVQVGPGSDLPIVLDVDEPLTVGADRVVNTLAASELYGRDTIVVDFGTATTFDCITGDARFLGGVIAPGVLTASEYLVTRAAKLPATELVAPPAVIGRRTEDCIRSGVLYGAADAADGIVRRIKAEWPGAAEPFVVATGGLAELVGSLASEIEHIEPDLTLLGCKCAAKHLSLAW